MQEIWKKFVYPLIEDKKHDVEEDTYHRHIENQLMLLGWEPWNGEIIHKQSLRIGNRNRMEPDILVARDDEYQFVIEVKRPNHIQQKEDINQLESYMRQLKLNTGVYIGEHIEVFYDKPNTNQVISVFKLAIDLEEKRGARIVGLFSKDNFSKENIDNFCNERLQEMERQASLNKIKESLIANAQIQISESLRPYLMDKYGNAFSEDEIKAMLSQLRFTVSTNGVNHTPVTLIQTVTQTNPIQSNYIIKCHLTRNANAHGLFNIKDQTLTVLEGSEVNSKHLTAAVEKKRAMQLEDYTILQAGKRIVKKDVVFKSPSGASDFCVGGSSNGWDTWKDEQGRELNEYRIYDGTRKSDARFDTNRVAEPHKFYRDFWKKFRNKLESTGVIPTLQTPRAQNWYNVRIGRSNILVNNICNTQKNFVSVRLYLRNPVVAKYYPALESRKNKINLALGCEPKWDTNPKAKDKTIGISYDSDLTDPDKTEEALNWLVQQTIVFYDVFSKEVKEI